MQKTQFAGLTELAPDESLIADNGAFVGKDRETIDRLLKLGAKTHRHTGLSGLGNPAGSPSASVIASGGTIPGDIGLAIGYTLQDGDQGETEISPTVAVSTPAPLQPPIVAPAAVIDYTAGSLTVDTYYYGITYIDGEGGETPLGPVSDGTDRAPGYANARVLLSGLTNGMATASATGWRLYRARGGGDFAYLASGAVNTYTDDGSVAPICDDNPPPDDFENTTNSINSLVVYIPDSPQIRQASFINLYASESGDFSGAVFLEQFPVGSAGKTALFRQLDLQDDQPPAVNLSIGGPAQIDPDTELLNWPWKRPASARAALGSGVKGDVKLVEDEGVLYAVLSASAASSAGWTALTPPPGGGGSGRRWTSAVVSGLASGASANLDFSGSAAGVHILKLSTSKRSRVRVYGDTAARTADRARGIGTDPTGDHGVQLDYAATAQASGGAYRVAPITHAWNLDDPAQDKLYLNITNYDATGDVVVAFLWVPEEVV